MKKLVLAIACLISGHLWGTVVDDLKASIAQFEAAQKQIDDAKKNLADTYAQIQKDVVNPMAAALPDIESYANSLQGVVNQLKALPDAVLTIACISDLRPTLQWIVDNPLTTLKNILTQVKTSFEQENNNLNPATDPLKILTDLNNAKQHFANAKEKMTKLKDILTAMPTPIP